MSPERLELIVGALFSALAQRERIADQLKLLDPSEASKYKTDSRLLLEAIVILQGWDSQHIELLRDLWDHGWGMGFSDRARGLHRRDYSRPEREKAIERLLDRYRSPVDTLERDTLRDTTRETLGDGAAGDERRSPSEPDQK